MSAVSACEHHFEISKHLKCQQLSCLTVFCQRYFSGGKGGNYNISYMPQFNTTASLEDLIKVFVNPSLNFCLFIIIIILIITSEINATVPFV